MYMYVCYDSRGSVIIMLYINHVHSNLENCSQIHFWGIHTYISLRKPHTSMVMAVIVCLHIMVKRI